MRAIVDLELKKVTDRLKEKKLKLDISENVKEFLIEKGYDDKLGARPLRRAVEKYLEDSLAEEVLSGSLRKNKFIRVLLTDDEDPSVYFRRKKLTKRYQFLLLPKKIMLRNLEFKLLQIIFQSLALYICKELLFYLNLTVCRKD